MEEKDLKDLLGSDYLFSDNSWQSSYHSGSFVLQNANANPTVTLQTTSGPVTIAHQNASGQYEIAEDYLADQYIKIGMEKAFGDRSHNFYNRLSTHLKSLTTEKKLDVILNIFSKDAINSYHGLDDEELYNFLRLTI